MAILSGHCSDSILGKRKDRSQFAGEEKEEEEAAASEIEDAATENKDAAVAEYEDVAAEYEDEDGVSKNKCRVCLQFGHWSYLCPCKRRVPEGIEVVGPGWRLVCWHCGLDEFNPDKSCVSCRTTLKRVSGIFCGICRADDHLSRDCPYEGMVDLTSNFDYYIPPPARTQGVCTEE